MTPIGYSINPTIKRGLDSLLRENGIVQSIGCAEQSSGCVGGMNGEKALYVHDYFIETASRLDPDQDILLHAALIISGATHFGHAEAARWPSRWFYTGRVFSVETVAEQIGGRIVRGRGRWGVLEISRFENSVAFLGCSIGGGGEMQSFVCLERRTEAKNVGLFQSLRSILVQDGWVCRGS